MRHSSVHYDFLYNHPEHAPKIAEWHYSEWGVFIEGQTLERTLHNLSDYCLVSATIPLAILALDENRPVGVCQLKKHELAKSYPDLTPWLGGVYVPESRRGHGIASQLVKHTINIARDLGVKHLYLHTNQLDGGIYRTLGWKPLEIRRGNTNTSLVMELQIDA